MAKIIIVGFWDYSRTITQNIMSNENVTMLTKYRVLKLLFFYFCNYTKTNRHNPTRNLGIPNTQCVCITNKHYIILY